MFGNLFRRSRPIAGPRSVPRSERSALRALSVLLVTIRRTVLAVWLALTRRGPPELELWRYGLLAISVCFSIVSALVYPYLFPVVVLWLWAGIVYGAGRQPDTAAVSSLPAQVHPQ